MSPNPFSKREKKQRSRTATAVAAHVLRHRNSQQQQITWHPLSWLADQRERESLAFSCLDIIHMRCIKWRNNTKKRTEPNRSEKKWEMRCWSHDERMTQSAWLQNIRARIANTEWQQIGYTYITFLYGKQCVRPPACIKRWKNLTGKLANPFVCLHLPLCLCESAHTVCTF